MSDDYKRFLTETIRFRPGPLGDFLSTDFGNEQRTHHLVDLTEKMDN